MACCAEFRCALFALALLAPAPEAQAQPQPDLAGKVAEVIAARWGVAAAAVHVELASERSIWPGAATPFRVQSAAADGTFLLAFDDNATRPLAVRAGIVSRAPVAARDLARGDTLTAAAIAFEPAVVWGPPRLPETLAAPGWHVKRRIAQGEPLRPPAVAPPLAVRAGDAVRIVLVRAGLTVALSGRAAGQAGIGERVAVRADTGRRLEGVATAPGVVTIEAPGREHP